MRGGRATNIDQDQIWRNCLSGGGEWMWLEWKTQWPTPLANLWPKQSSKSACASQSNGIASIQMEERSAQAIHQKPSTWIAKAE